MNDKHPEQSADQESDFESLLDDLYSLQESLIQNQPRKEIELPKTESNGDLDSLDIPILTESLDEEIGRHQTSGDKPAEVQHHLFEEPEQSPQSKPQLSEEQINTIVEKIVTRSLPTLKEKLRQRVRSKVIARLEQSTRQSK